MTSGSTGQPKPINLTQNNKYERAMAHIKLYDITENDRILAATPLYHSLAERLVLLPLLIGATSILLPRFTPSIWLNCVYEQKVTFTIAVTAQLSQIAQLLSSPFVPDISSLRSIVSSSALLEPYVRMELIDKLKCDFHEMYGTSETSTATSINFRESINKQKSVGRFGMYPRKYVLFLYSPRYCRLPAESQIRKQKKSYAYLVHCTETVSYTHLDVYKRQTKANGQQLCVLSHGTDYLCEDQRNGSRQLPVYD